MEELSLGDYFAILRQRKFAFLIAFGAVMAVTLLTAGLWSNYRSNATVEIEQPQVAPDTTTPIGMSANDSPNSLADLRVSKIQQKVTAPASLVELISKFNLYPDSRKHDPMAVITDRMKSKIKLELVTSTIANPAATTKVSVDQLSAIAFNLSFDYSDPQTAQLVLNDLITRFLDEDLKDRKNDAQATSDFLDKQLKAMESSMAEQEKKIAEFQSEHGISRPESVLFNQQAAANTTMSLQTLDSQISTNQGTQGQIRAQLTTVDPYTRVIADGQVLTTPAIQLKALQAQYTTLTAQYGPEHPDVQKVKHQIEALRGASGISTGSAADTGALKAQIKDVQTNLDSARKSYGPDNPDVVSLQHQLESLQTQLADAKKGSASGLGGIHQDADNPAYLQLVAQLSSAQEQYKSLLTQREQLVAQQQKYQNAVMASPDLEQQMAALSRDYDNIQLRYRELKEKKMAADMDVQMIEDRKGQRLVVIDPPDLPMKTHPRQLLILLAGFALAMMAGLASVILVQAMHQTIIGAQHLESLLGVAPLISIPHLYTDREKGQSRYKKSQAMLRDFISRRSGFLGSNSSN